MPDGSLAQGLAGEYRWLCVYTKPRCEQDALKQLERQCYQCFLPRLRNVRQRRGARTALIEPMFPRYLFLRANWGEQNLAPVRSTRSVIDFVRFGGKIGTVPDVLVEGLMRAADPAGVILLDAELRPGEQVRVVDGPFLGLEGIYKARSGEQRVIVLLNLLGREQAIRVPATAVERLRQYA